MTDNLRIWNEVSKTDPKQTKDVDFGRKFTSINPHWNVFRATQLWGPFGSTWGLRDVSYEIVTVDDGKDKRKTPMTTTVVMRGEFFYPDGQFNVIADWCFRHDDDTFKKVETALLSKALSRLGFSADIFLKKWEDQQYRTDVERTFVDEGGIRDAAIIAIEGASNVDLLDKCKARVDQLMADDLICGSTYRELEGRIEKRRGEL